MQTEEIAKIVGEVLKRLESQSDWSSAPTAAPRASADIVVHSTVDSAVETGRKAQRVFQDLGLEQRHKIIKAMRKASLAQAQRLAELAVKETGMGRAADKAVKNQVCALRTPGPEDLQSRAVTGDKGLTLTE